VRRSVTEERGDERHHLAHTGTREVTNASGPSLAGRYTLDANDTEEVAVNETQAGRILLVVPESTDDFTASVLERLDHSVTTCHGPDADTDCPLVHGEGCAWYEEAHGIVFALDLTRPAHRDIVSAYERLAEAQGRDIPMRVIVPPGSDLPAELDLLAWSEDPTVAELDGFAALVEAADRSR